jgi:hypothetical protein
MDFKESTITNYSGLSTETKPTIAAGTAVPNGSRWREIDTCKTYHFDIATDAWYQTSTQIDSATHAIETIDYPHHEIHGASHFYVEGNVTLGVAGTLFIKLVVGNVLAWPHFTWQVNSSGILTATLDEDATGGMAGGLVTTIHCNNRNKDCWTGRHDGLANAAALTDTTKAWVVDELVGMQVFNSADGSSGIITANTATVVTATLAGGTDSDFDIGDEYEINKSRTVITSGVTVNTDYIQRISNQKFGSKSGGSVSREDELMLKQNAVYLRAFTSGTASNIIGFKANWYEHTDKL